MKAKSEQFIPFFLIVLHQLIAQSSHHLFGPCRLNNVVKPRYLEIVKLRLKNKRLIISSL